MWHILEKLYKLVQSKCFHFIKVLLKARLRKMELLKKLAKSQARLRKLELLIKKSVHNYNCIEEVCGKP